MVGRDDVRSLEIRGKKWRSEWEIDKSWMSGLSEIFHKFVSLYVCVHRVKAIPCPNSNSILIIELAKFKPGFKKFRDKDAI